MEQCFDKRILVLFVSRALLAQHLRGHICTHKGKFFIFQFNTGSNKPRNGTTCQKKRRERRRVLVFQFKLSLNNILNVT